MPSDEMLAHSGNLGLVSTNCSSHVCRFTSRGYLDKPRRSPMDCVNDARLCIWEPLQRGTNAGSRVVRDEYIHFRRHLKLLLIEFRIPSPLQPGELMCREQDKYKWLMCEELRLDLRGACHWRKRVQSHLRQDLRLEYSELKQLCVTKSRKRSAILCTI